MKELIDWTDIRKGDSIREERIRTEADFTGYAAVEYVANFDRHMGLSHSTYYLLDRPKPAVVVPEKPTLGWVTTPYLDAAVIGSFGAFDRELTRPRRRVEYIDGDWTPATYVTAFREGVLVPKDALDELRKIHDADGDTTDADGMTPFQWWEEVGTFLTAVDEATGAL